LAEADRRVLHGVCHWTRLAKYVALALHIALWVIVAILNLIRSWTHNQCSLLKVAKTMITITIYVYIYTI